MNRHVRRLLAAASALAGAAVLAGPALAAGNVDISQVYGGGGNSGATLKNDYIELYNRGSAAVDVSGWSVQYASSAGSSWSRTDLAGSIAPGTTYLIQEAAGAGGTQSLPSPNATGSINMSATAGKVALVSSQTTIASGTTCPTDASIVDFVGYGSANCFEGSGPAPALTNTTADIRNDGGLQDTDQNAADFTAGAPTYASGGGGGGSTPTALKIDQIQGNTQFSPVEGQQVSTTGIVTAVRSDGSGFFMEDPNPDSDPTTSEGIFVYTGSTAPAVASGDSVRVVGKVDEYVSSSAPDDLPQTELENPTVSVLSSGNALPAPVLIGAGGLTPPGASVPDGIDFDEALEGMLVELDDLQAVSATNSFGETWVVPNDGAGASPLDPRGGIVLTQDDQNPEKFLVDDDVFGTGGLAMPDVNVGARSAGAHVGVMDYQFDNYAIHLLQQPTFTPSPIAREVTSVASGADKLTVATFNVENLSPADDPSKFSGLANVLVNNLGAPDIVALEEVQDNDGPADDGVVDSTQTLNELANAVLAAGGPQYAYAWVNPVNDQDGGEPGGNIRVVFFYRTDVPGLSFAPGTTGGSTDAEAVVGTGNDTSLLYNPGRIDPTSSAWAASRKPLAGEFLFNGHKVFVVANHFVAKLGDDPMWGQHQPPVNSSEPQRHQQANEVASFVQSLLSADPDANVLVVGDLNDFQFSDTISILEAAGLHDLVKDLPVDEQYTYVFDGNSQAIDHILVGGSLEDAARDYDVVHVNSEFFDQVSDHDPQVASFELAQPAVSAGGPYSVDEGSTVALHATGDGTIRWDLDGNGTYETAGADATFDATALDGPSTKTIGVESVSADGTTATATTTVTIRNVAPTATFSAPPSATIGAPFTIALQSPSDPSQADTAAGFTYAFDCGDGFGTYSTKASASCTATASGPVTVRGRIRDRDGGVSTYSDQVDVGVTVQAVCSLTLSYIESSAKYKALPPVARKAIDALGQSACAKLGTLLTPKPSLKAAEVKAYTAAVKTLAQLGWLTAAQANELIADAKAL